MDISEIKAGPREYEMTHPGTGKPLGIHIQLLPLHHPEVKKVEREIRNEVLKIRQRGKALTAHEVEDNERRLIGSAVAGWRWEADPARDIEQPLWKGEIPEFNASNVKSFIRVEWVKEQLDGELGDIADFFKE